MILDKEISDEIRKRIEEVVKERGLDLVDFKIFPQGKRWVIRSIVDYPEGGVRIKECVSLNRVIFSILEKDIKLKDFIVEVNSPGLDRPLREARDFVRAKGKIVCIWLKESLGGKTYLEGEIVEVEENALLLKIKENIFKIPFNIIVTLKQKIAIKENAGGLKYE